MSFRVEVKIGEGQNITDRRVIFAQCDGDSGEKFFCLERFCHVIDSALQQEFYFAVHIDFGTEDDDRKVFDPGQKFLPGETGKHQIQQNEIRLHGGQQKDGFRAGISPENLIVFFPEDFLSILPIYRSSSMIRICFKTVFHSFF